MNTTTIPPEPHSHSRSACGALVDPSLRNQTLLAEIDQTVQSVSHALFCDEMLPSTIEQIGELSGEVAASGNADIIANCKWQLSRLLRRLERSSRVEVSLHGALRCSVSSLRAALLASSSPDKFTHHQTIESRILEALMEGPKRPHSLADQFGLDPSGISRALRRLREKGLVTKIATPWWETDIRASWYEIIDPEIHNGFRTD